MSRRAYQQRRAARAARHATHHAPSDLGTLRLGRCADCGDYRFLSDDERRCVSCAAPATPTMPMGVSPCAP